jgi:hypothetical protein
VKGRGWHVAGHQRHQAGRARGTDDRGQRPVQVAGAGDGGYARSAEELVRVGWAYASVIDHHPLMAYLRLDLANIAYWANR